MASSEKFTNDAICNMLRHNNRETSAPSNRDIDPERSELNYSFPTCHDGMPDYEYYKKLTGEKYLYGRGTNREKDAITGCGWVVTLPRELYGDADKEKAFFNGVYDFISERYGAENILNNSVHYDEAGLPHIHVIFCPVTTLDHEIVQHKTVKTSNAVKLDSGRYEYTYRFKLDENGEKIALKNYAKMSDYYDEKIDCNSVLNKAELSHFHKDLQQYLKKNGIEGNVNSGSTGGINFSVEELKDFTKETGLTLSDVKELLGDKTLLEGLVDSTTKVNRLEEILNEKETIAAEKIKELQQALETKQLELDQAKQRINELEHENEMTHESAEIEIPAETENVWGATEDSGWNSHTTDIEETFEW